MDCRKTGELIKAMRIEKNMKQKDLAEQLFVSTAAVSKWENGHGFPDISVLLDLCKILDLSVEELMKGEKESMENKENTSINDLIEIAGHQQKKQKKIIKMLCVLLMLMILCGLFQAVSIIMHNKKIYLTVKVGSDLFGTNMYIENNGNTPTLCYKGKKFEQIYEFFISDPDKNQYLIVSIESNPWNETFGFSGSGQFTFQTFNELSGNHIDIYDWFIPDNFKGVYLYEGDLRDFISHFIGFTRVNVKRILNNCTYIPYSKEIININKE